MISRERLDELSSRIQPAEVGELIREIRRLQAWDREPATDRFMDGEVFGRIMGAIMRGAGTLCSLPIDQALAHAESGLAPAHRIKVGMPKDIQAQLEIGVEVLRAALVFAREVERINGILRVHTTDDFRINGGNA